MSYDELCKNCLELDTQIRFSGVVNNKGELISGGDRGDVESLLSPSEVKMSIHYTIQRWEKAQNLAHKIGNEQSTITEFDKVSLITIPVERNLLLISTTPNSDYAKITKDAKNLIEKFLN